MLRREAVGTRAIPGGHRGNVGFAEVAGGLDDCGRRDPGRAENADPDGDHPAHSTVAPRPSAMAFSGAGDDAVAAEETVQRFGADVVGAAIA